MGQYTKWISRIFDDMDDLLQSCKAVQDADRCEDCNLKRCLCYDSMSEVFEECTVSDLEEFISFTDTVVITEDDRIADNADLSRQDDAVYGE